MASLGISGLECCHRALWHDGRVGIRLRFTQAVPAVQVDPLSCTAAGPHYALR